MKKIIITNMLVLSCLMLTGCVSKMVGGAVSIATLGLVKDDTKKHYHQQIEKYIDKKEIKENS